MSVDNLFNLSFSLVVILFSLAIFSLNSKVHKLEKENERLAKSVNPVPATTRSHDEQEETGNAEWFYKRPGDAQAPLSKAEFKAMLKELLSDDGSVGLDMVFDTSETIVRLGVTVEIDYKEVVTSYIALSADELQSIRNIK